MTDPKAELIEKLATILANQPDLLRQVTQYLYTGQSVNQEGSGIVIGDVIVATQGSYVINRSDGAWINLAEQEHNQMVQAFLEYRRRVVGEEVIAIAESATLQPGARLDLQGKGYVVRQIIVQQTFGQLIVRTARATDLSLNRNVGIRQTEALTDDPQVCASLEKVKNRAQKLDQAAAQSTHLPRLYDIIKSTNAVWTITEWVEGQPLNRILPPDHLPEPAKLAKVLSWAADICEALSTLHRQHLLHGAVNGQTIHITKGQRGAVLIDPGFIQGIKSLTLEPPSFDPTIDIKALAATLYQVVTLQPSQVQPASKFNPAASSTLDEALQAGVSGSIRRVDAFKSALLAARRTL